MSTVLDTSGPVVRRGLAATAPVVVLLTLVAGGPLALLGALAAVGTLLAVLAARHPRAALVVALAVVALVPFYDGRYVTGAVGITPMTAACLVLLPAAVRALPAVRLTALDVAVAAVVLLRVAALALNFQGAGSFLVAVLGIALPYAVFRVLTLGVDVPALLARTVVVTAGVLSVLALGERSGRANVFFTLFPADYQAAQWARPELRGGLVRAEASFGHPIAFGMFLAFAVVLALALALTAHSLPARLSFLGTSGLLLLALNATAARGALLAAGVAVVVWLLATARRLDVLRLLAVAGALVAVVVSTPLLATVQGIDDSVRGDSREALSAQYRLEVLAVAVSPEQFSLLGKETAGQEGTTAALSARTGLKSVDSEYALVFLTAGALSLAALAVVVVLVVATAVRPGLSPVERAWAAGLAGACANLVTVALLTQFGEIFWASAALVASLAQQQRQQRS